MWLEKFLDIINNFLPSNPLSGKEEALARLNPDKIYIENVRSVLGVSQREALDICESAVRQGFLKRGIEVLCPDGAAAASADAETDLPPTVKCWTQDEEEVVLPTDSLRKVNFYRLNEQSTVATVG